MDPFVAWNLRLLQAFFSRASKGDEVWLAVSPEELDAIAPDLGGDEGFVSAVRGGPPWPSIWDGRRYNEGSPTQFTDRALGLHRQRTIRISRPLGYEDPGSIATDYSGCDAPTYLPYLAALIRGAALRGNESGYYDALRSTFRLPSNWSTQEMAELERLWRDLATWSSRGDAQFGRFIFRQLGGYRYVGIPTSQSIVSRRDLRELPRIFAQSGVRAGQRVTERLIEEVRLTAANSPFLSSPFLKALGEPAFRVPVQDRLKSLLEDWDGSVVSHGGSSVTSGGRAKTAFADSDSETTALGLALGLSPGNALPWRVLWRSPAIRDVGSLKLRKGEAEWSATFRGTDDVTVASRNADGAAPEVAAALLATSEREDVLFDAYLNDGDTGAPRLPVRLAFRKGILRTLVGGRESGLDGDEVLLREHPLPAYGGAYILASPSNVDRLELWFSVNRVSHQRCPSDGLPDGWVLEHLPDCTQIGDDARDRLPDGASERAQPRVVRLVGGRSIQRAGLRQYLSYDLPRIELDAPRGSTLDAPGLQLREVGQVLVAQDSLNAAGLPLAQTPGLRLIDISLLDSRSRSFTICARHEGHVVGEARLRLAPQGGLAVAAAGQFRLDSEGIPNSSGSGLLGVLHFDEAMAAQPSSLQESAGSLGNRRAAQVGGALTDTDLLIATSQPAARFLDSLAQAGSMAYGVARDQLLRLLGDFSTTNPAAVLTELRSRGFLEIEADAKGRWVRVHATPPTLCVLPHLHHGGLAMACIVGTLRQQHWRELLQASSWGCTAVGDDAMDNPAVPVAWLLAPSCVELRSFSAAASFALALRPAMDVAEWAASLAQVREDLHGSGVESLGTLERSVERFVPVKGHFSASSRAATLDDTLTCQLFRVEDAETGHHQIYSLGYRDQAHSSRYTFVRDSRWGVWLALSAFSEFALKEYGIADASPWPFHHDLHDGTLWLPARINLPVVLERALVLCSGARPRRVQVTGRSEGDGHLLMERSTGRALGAVSRVYSDMSPASPAWSTWLGYRWVATEVARIVASKLGGQLLPFYRF